MTIFSAPSAFVLLPSSSPPKTSLFKYNTPNLDTDRSPVVLIQPEEVESGSIMWHTSAVGFVIDSQPSFMSMKKFIQARWKEYGQVKLYRMEYGWFVFKFVSVEARDRAVERDTPWTFSEQPLVLKPWTPTVKMTEEELDVIPIWIRFPNLPLWVYDSKMLLTKIASYVGKPLCRDRLTGSPKRLAYARLLVEVKAGSESELPCEVPLKIEGQDLVMQEVIYDWVFVQCELCEEIGHMTRDCHLEESEDVGLLAAKD